MQLNPTQQEEINPFISRLSNLITHTLSVRNLSMCAFDILQQLTGSKSQFPSCCVVPQVYGEYRASLAFDLVSSRQKNVSDAISTSIAACS